MASIGADINKPVAMTVKVRYELNNYMHGSGGGTYDGAIQNWRWYIAYHWYDQTGEEPEAWAKDKDDAGNSTQRLFFVKKWTKVGRHRVSCTGKNRQTRQKEDFAEKEQQVEERGTFLERQMERSKKKPIPNPHAELTMTWKWLSFLDAAAKVDGALPTKEVKEQHEKQVKEIEAYAQKLKALLEKCNPDVIWPFRAVYLAEESMSEKELRVFITQPKGQKDRLMIVDWTNLDEPKMWGTYVGKFPEWKGRTQAAMIDAAFMDAIDTWEKDNKYWVGGIRYEFERTFSRDSAVGRTGTIKTGEKGFKETLTEYLKKIALGAALIGLVLTGVGSAWAGAFIVTSMVAGTTGSVLSIHTRHSKGTGSFIDDAMDVLDIVGNVLGIGGRAGKAILWRKGATLELMQGSKAIQALFIGEVWADGFNGMLLGAKFISDYDAIMSARMTPDERARKLVELFGQAAQAGLLIGLNHKITTAIEEAKWKRLMESTPDGKPLRFDDKPTIKGKTEEGGKNVTVVTKQKRQEPAKVDSTPKTQAFPPKDDPKWHRYDVKDNVIDLKTKDGFSFYAHVDDKGIVNIDIHTRKPDNSQSSLLGTGRENFNRMFQHFEANGHEIKGWSGMFIEANYAAAKKALDSGIAKNAKEAVLHSVTGKEFWKPWAESKGYKIVVVDASINSSFLAFEVKFVK